MTNQLTRISVAAVLLPLCHAAMADAQTYKVGTFTKNTTVASACSSGCPTNVVTHNLGDAPKALIVWSDGKTNSSFSGSFVWTFGMTDGATSRSASAASTNNSANSKTNRRDSSKFVGFVSGGGSGTVIAEADFTAWDATTFTITWSTNDNQPYILHYVLIGGASVNAKVVVWQSPSTTSVKSVTGIGFQPTVVLNVNHGHTMAYSSLGGVPSSNIVGTHGGFGLGVMNDDAAQWSSGFYAIDSAGTMDTQRGQQINSTWFTASNNLTTTKTGVCVSPCMTADGYDIDFTVAGSDLGGVAFSMALSGVNFWIGSFNKNTTSASSCSSGCPQNAITGMPFSPSVVMLASAQDIARTTAQPHARFGLGVSDGTTQASSAFTDTDATASSTVWGIDKTTKAFMKVNNAGTTTVAPVIDAEGSVAMTTDGFTMTWSTNDTVATEILYFAFGAIDVTAVELTSLNATRYDARVLVNWRTGYEVDNLGFNVYRDVNGRQTRVTRSLVAGSGLMAGQGTATRGEHRYAFWDTDPEAAEGSAVYWLEDVDFRGVSTWHGPIAPVAGGLQTPPEISSSSALRDLAKRAKRRGHVFSTQTARAGLAKERPRAARAGTVQPDAQVQQTLAGGRAIKIGINQAGWYRVTQPQLLAAGLDPQIDPRTLSLFVDGIEQAIAVTGDTDGRFDAADRIEFYGLGADTPYTDSRTYWLVAGLHAGQRVARHPAPARAGIQNSAASFPFTLQQKERSIYFAALRNGDEENWFGAFISDEPTELSLRVSNIVPGSAAEMDVALQGVTSDPTVEFDHRVAVVVNGVDVGELTFDGQTKSVQSFAIPAGILVDGDNTVTLTSRGGEADYSLVDVIRVNYAHLYRADADVLRFTASGPNEVTVTDFASPSIRVLDITDASAVEELRPLISRQDGFSAVTVRIHGEGTRTLLAFGESAVLAPAFVRRNTPSHWAAPGNSADYVAIAHADFAQSLVPLIERRAHTGLSVAYVDIEDVYDEFSFGEKTPQALKDFVTNARTQWKNAPRFLLLVGDATLDPRDYAGLGDGDFVPTKQVPMAQISLETASDDWFADSDNDGLPELAIGRLPVRTAEQAREMISKVLEYEDSNGAGWTRNVLLVADQNDEHSDFEASADALGHALPPGYTVQRISAGMSGGDIARMQILDAVNQGRLIVNYTGHGSVRIWGSEGTILTSEDIATSWQNASRLPFVVAMNCLNGFFHGIYDEESLAETLLRTPGGGAVAAWASSGLTDSATQLRVNQEIFRLLFGSAKPTMGEAAAAAKQAISNPDVRRSWIFFGDPALRLK
jgi:hypothetical protein